MANDSRACRVFCPFFFRFDGKNTIVCEGVAPRTEVRIAFTRRDELDRWAEEKCQSETGYRKCRMAQMLNGKYPDK